MASGGFQRPREFPGRAGAFGLRASPALQASGFCLSGASGGLRGPLGPSGGLRDSGRGLRPCKSQDVGFGSALAWADPEIPAFPGHLQGRPGQWAPKTTPRRPRRPRWLGLGFLNNLVNHRKGEGPLGGAPAPAPGGAAHALNHSLGLHSISKRWCE